MTRRRGARPVAFHGDAPRSGIREHADGTVAPVLLTDFDVSGYAISAPGRIRVDAPAITAQLADAQMLDDSVLATLRRDLVYLFRIDAAALTETRTMYSSWTANEARITAFLASWLWERSWWARALRDVANALPATTGNTEVESAAEAVALRPGAMLRRTYVRRALPILGPAWTWAAGESVTAGHMARMTIQEGSMLAAIRALLPRAESVPEIHRVLSTLAERRARTLEFFRSEAIARITRSRAEAITARLVLAVGGDPLRPAGQPVAEEDAARASIFRGAHDRAALRRARYEIVRLLPGPSRPLAAGGDHGLRP